MARRSDREDSLSEIRRLLRGLRSQPATQWTRALRGAVDIALFRLPSRQQTIVRRYDLGGERASVIQRDLGLSPRQFFRDRRAGLELLSNHVFVPESAACAADASAATETPYERGIAARVYARSLAQSADARCLDVLGDLAATAREPAQRADLLLELAEAAIDCADERVAEKAAGEASPLVDDLGDAHAALRGRLALVRAHLSQNFGDALSLVAQAATTLRASLARGTDAYESALVLADALGDATLLHYTLGRYAPALAASLEAVETIERFGLRKSPKSLEILGTHAAIESCVNGRARAAAAGVASLLRFAVDSGWSATAFRLGSTLVGLNAICGEYDEAIRWYDRLAPFSHGGARPSDRANIAMEAAHSYTMAGRSRAALALLGYVAPEQGCPHSQRASWHAVAGAALANLGDDAAAIAEARSALSVYSSRGLNRGVGDAHRLLAICYAHRGDARRAREHIDEARRLVERYGVPYALLLTLVSEAAIVRSAAARSNAIEYRRLLQRLASS